MAKDIQKKRVAYLTGQYPAVSHTFIQREITALQGLGLDIRPCSIRRPLQDHLLGPQEQQAEAETFYVLATAKRIWPLLAGQFAMLRRPGRYVSALKLAWQTRTPGIQSLIYQLFYFLEASVLAHHFQKQGITHVHNHFADSSANVAVLAAKLAGIDFSYTLHGPAELFEPYRWQLPIKTAEAKFVVCISHFARSQAMYFSDPSDWDKLKIVHCGIEPALYETSPEKAAADEVRLIFVGRLAPIKGLRVLIEAFEKVRLSRPGLRLTLVGDGEDRANLELLAAGMDGAIEFTGYQSQDAVAGQLAKADILVLPSFAEGVPVVLMEAMASRKPVITSIVAGIPELVEDGVSGFLVPPGDPVALAEKIDVLAGDAARRLKMGVAGRAKVQVEFNSAIEAARIGALFLDQGGEEIRPDPLSTTTKN